MPNDSRAEVEPPPAGPDLLQALLTHEMAPHDHKPCVGCLDAMGWEGTARAALETLIVPVARGAPTPAMIDAARKVVAQWEVRSADDQHGGYISICDDCDGVGEDEHPETIAHAPTCVIGALRAALTAQEQP